MAGKWSYWLKQIVQTAAVVMLVAVAVDWRRKPQQPLTFAQTEWQTMAGVPVTLAELSRNRTVAVYFWGSWCGVCRHTSPVFECLYQNGVPVLGVALQSGSADEVSAYMQSRDLSFDNVNDPSGQIAGQWQIKVTPTIVMVKDGKMVHHTTGLSSYWGLRSRIWLIDWLY